jgi:hypothetical protein
MRSTLTRTFGLLMTAACSGARAERVDGLHSGHAEDVEHRVMPKERRRRLPLIAER